MTREKKSAARSAAYRAASLLTGALMVAALSGCGGGLFQISDTADASLGQKVKPAVAVSPVQGVPQKYASKVNEQILASMKAKGVQVVDAKDAQYIIKPVYVALPEPQKGTKVTYAIDVTDKAGNRVRRIEGEELVSDKRGGDAWSHVTDESAPARSCQVGNRCQCLDRKSRRACGCTCSRGKCSACKACASASHRACGCCSGETSRTAGILSRCG